MWLLSEAPRSDFADVVTPPALLHPEFSCWKDLSDEVQHSAASVIFFFFHARLLPLPAGVIKPPHTLLCNNNRDRREDLINNIDLS